MYKEHTYCFYGVPHPGGTAIPNSSFPDMMDIPHDRCRDLTQSAATATPTLTSRPDVRSEVRPEVRSPSRRPSMTPGCETTKNKHQASANVWIYQYY